MNNQDPAKGSQNNEGGGGGDGGGGGAGDGGGGAGEGGGGAGEVALVKPDGKFDVSAFSQDVQTALGKKKIDDVGGLTEAYVNLEKLVGSDTIAKPAEGELVKWMGENKAAIGVPEAAEAYKLPEVKLPDGMEFDKELDAKARAFALERNIPQDLFNEFAGFVMQSRVDAFNQATESSSLDRQKTMTELKGEWGNDFNAKLEQAQMAARALEVPAETLDKLNGEMSSPTLIRLFQNLGERFSEGVFKGGDGGGLSGGAAAAKAKINDLKQDEAFMKRLRTKAATGHNEAKAEWQRLHAEAEGEKPD